MDSSMSKALIIAAGVLLAMIVIAFMTYSFRQLGSWATEQDQVLLTEQKDKFNKEYEVYDKDLMYGVDVISCLNKAMSNNEQITNNRFVTGDTYDISYEVKVRVTLKNKTLEESITVYHISNANKKQETRYMENDGPTGVKIEDVKFSFIENNTDYFHGITEFKKNDGLKTKTQPCKKSTCTEFNITKDKNGTGEIEIRDLLSVASAISEVKKNPDKANSGKEDSWTKAEFKSALYDLKTRRFTCSNLTYDANTGRVNYIEFTEM